MSTVSRKMRTTSVGQVGAVHGGFVVYWEIPPDNASALAVASVDLNGFDVAAQTLAGSVDRLPDVPLFHANSNLFGGTLPPAVAALRYLYELDVSNNELSGPFPNVEGLTFLDIGFNLFAGSVPPQIFMARNLNALFINDNDFVRIDLPPSLAPSRIVYLTLVNNRFAGPIPPTALKLFSAITEVLLSNNELAGCLPYEVGSLRKAVVFDVGYNRLTGPLLVSLACLENVEQLNFAGNLRYGVVPEVVCELENLANFTLSSTWAHFVGV